MSQDVMKLMRDKLIEARTIEERKIEEFAQGLSSVNIEEVFGDTYIPPNISLKALCPEAYKDTPNPDIYDTEFKAMQDIFIQLNSKIVSYNAEAIECLNQFKMIN